MLNCFTNKLIFYIYRVCILCETGLMWEHDMMSYKKHNVLWIHDHQLEQCVVEMWIVITRMLCYFKNSNFLLCIAEKWLHDSPLRHCEGGQWKTETNISQQNCERRRLWSEPSLCVVGQWAPLEEEYSRHNLL